MPEAVAKPETASGVEAASEAEAASEPAAQRGSVSKRIGRAGSTIRGKRRRKSGRFLSMPRSVKNLKKQQ